MVQYFIFAQEKGQFNSLHGNDITFSILWSKSEIKDH